jgi:hypothetical protein
MNSACAWYRVRTNKFFSIYAKFRRRAQKIELPKRNTEKLRSFGNTRRNNEIFKNVGLSWIIFLYLYCLIIEIYGSAE